MSADVFVDTNVVAYLIGQDAAKRATARALLSARPTINTQVVTEFVNVCTRKARLEMREARGLIEALMSACTVRPVDADTVHRGLEIAERYRLSHWDALIVAAALAAGCAVLYSEDMHDGQTFDGRLTLVNPFGPASH